MVEITLQEAERRNETPLAFAPNFSYVRTFPEGLLAQRNLDMTPLIHGSRLAEVASSSGRVWTVSATGDMGEIDVLSLGPSPYDLVVAVGKGEATRIEEFRAFGGKVSFTCQAEFTPDSVPPLWRPFDIPLTGDAPAAVSAQHPMRPPQRPIAKAMEAVTDVARWLSVSQRDAARLCQVSVRATQYWVSGKTKVPRPSSVRRLYAVHAFLKALTERLGEEGATVWLRQPSETGPMRLALLESEEGPATLLDEAASILFEMSPQPERPIREDLDAERADAWAAPYERTAFHGPVRRPRRVMPR